jgi:ubiquinone/menaquinone biosynthesis C-methylase UbiE
VFVRPKHLGSDYASVFRDQSVAEAYRYRPPYPPEVFQILLEIADRPNGTMLDVGTGRGDIARPMTQHMQQVDAVDFSEAMIAIGRRLPFGSAPNLRWICSSIENAEISGPYGLITAGQSLQWFDLDMTMPKLAALLSPRGVLAIVDKYSSVAGLKENDLIRKYSTNQDYVHFDLIEAITTAGLFKTAGQKGTVASQWLPTVAEYIERRHSQNGFSRERMGKARALAYDTELRDRIEAQVRSGAIDIDGDRLGGSTVSRVTWGVPLG